MSGDLIARCRAALAASDETAKVAQSVSWPHENWWNAPTLASKLLLGTTLERSEADADARFIADNDPSTRLALNRALTVVLDGIEATGAEHHGVTVGLNVDPARPVCRGEHNFSRYAPCEVERRATASLAAIAEALGVQP